MSDVQHKEWFISALLPHIRTSLMQHKLVLQIEALEIAMKLEASPVGDTYLGMMQIQLHLANLTVQLQIFKEERKFKRNNGVQDVEHTNTTKINVQCS